MENNSKTPVYKNRNLYILLALVVVIIAAAIAGTQLNKTPDDPKGDQVELSATATPVTADPTAEAQPEATAVPETEPTVVPAKGYVLVTLGLSGQYGWLALPEEGEESIPVTQTDADGNEHTNVVHLSPEGVYMESSTCDNQDCVKQGDVTAENRETRILGNMIVCLPNQVTLELYTPEDILNMTNNTQN